VWEAGWVRLRTLECPVPGLPRELEGVRIAHLSDLHLGTPSRGAAAAARAVEWTAAREPDLVCLTGDLLSRPRGLPELERLLARLPRAYAVLGNHDVGVATDPFARASAPLELRGATLLEDEAATVEVRGLPVQLVGVDPLAYMRRDSRAAALADEGVALRILLAHFPRAVERLPRRFELVLAGHYHDGQIALPLGRGRKLRFAELHAPYPCGLYRFAETTMHVSPGLGTSFVPLRFAARPEATELVLARG
jgi:predicted MPP superfamily phosphohydrolase